MIRANSLLTALGLKQSDRRQIASATGIPEEIITYWERNSLLPSRVELRKLCEFSGVSSLEVELRMAAGPMADFLSTNAIAIASAIKNEQEEYPAQKAIQPVFRTELGELFQGDCLQVMRNFESRSFDMIFADPPFNLNKAYPSKIDDERKERDYLAWCYEWLDECVRLLKANGSLFVYNLPRWNIKLAEFLSARLSYRDWITIDLKGHLPLAGRLYPSHYSLIYFCNGERPATFHPDRLPMRTCPNCHADLVDYGGYKAKMNPRGVSLTDVWTDIPLVRHASYKNREGANELSIKLVDRVIEMATNEGNRIFDPFGGSGTTFLVAELKNRRWAGSEVGPVDGIIERFRNKSEEAQYLLKVRAGYNSLFLPNTAHEREKRKLWTTESVRSDGESALSREHTDLLL